MYIINAFSTRLSILCICRSEDNNFHENESQKIENAQTPRHKMNYLNERKQKKQRKLMNNYLFYLNYRM